MINQIDWILYSDSEDLNFYMFKNQVSALPEFVKLDSCTNGNEVNNFAISNNIENKLIFVLDQDKKSIESQIKEVFDKFGNDAKIGVISDKDNESLKSKIRDLGVRFWIKKSGNLSAILLDVLADSKRFVSRSLRWKEYN